MPTMLAALLFSLALLGACTRSTGDVPPAPTLAAPAPVHRNYPEAPPIPLPGRITGELVNVQDGDSFRLRLAAGGVIRVRIGAIDAPELGQPHADSSRDRLQALLSSSRITVDAYKTDAFGRYVATVYADSRDVGLLEVGEGLAWHFTRYAREQNEQQRRDYSAAQQAARRQGLGLWSDSTPLAPWDYRRRAAQH